MQGTLDCQGFSRRPLFIVVALVALFIAALGVRLAFKPTDWFAGTGLQGLMSWVSSGSLRISLKPGDDFHYDLNSTSRTVIDPKLFAVPLAGITGAAIETSITAQLDVHVYEAKAGDPSSDRFLGLCLTGLSYTADGKDQDFERALSQPFGARFSQNGAFRALVFMHGTQEAARALLSRLVYGLQVVFPREPKAAWKTQETDGVDFYRASYRIENRNDEGRTVVEKLKMSFLSTSIATNPFVSTVSQLSIEQRVAHARTEIVIDQDAGWIAEVSSDEALVLVPLATKRGSGQAASLGTIKQRLQARRVSGVRGFAFPKTLAAFEALLIDRKFAQAQHYKPLPGTTTAQAQGALPVTDLISSALELLAQGTDGKREARKSIINYLRRYPERSQDFVNVLDQLERQGGDASPRLRLWQWLVEAGHREAQTAVLGATGDAYGVGTRYRAVAYLHDFATPWPETMDELYATYERQSAQRALPATGDGFNNAEYPALLLYAYGSLARSKNLDERARARAVEHLGAELRSAGDGNQTREALDAIGNAGASTLLPALAPAFGAEDPKTRATAFSALRNMDPAQAAPELLRRCGQEHNPQVQVVALKTLGNFPPDVENNRWVANLARSQSTHPTVRGAAISLLGQGITAFPENAQILRSIAQGTETVEIKRDIYRIVSP